MPPLQLLQPDNQIEDDEKQDPEQGDDDLVGGQRHRIETRLVYIKITRERYKGDKGDKCEDKKKFRCLLKYVPLSLLSLLSPLPHRKNDLNKIFSAVFTPV